nr:putative ribonuclease H-like domain-containing protein [Tanacetum cinerariifolium]
MRKTMLKQEFLEFRIGKAEGLHKGYDRMQKILNVLQSFVADTEPKQLAYEDLEQIEKLDLEETDLKWKMAMLFVRVHKFKQKARRKIDFDKKESSRYSSFKIKEIGKKEEDSKALITVDTLVEWTNHDSESDGVIAAKEFGMIAGCDSEDAIKEGAAKLYNQITGANSEEANTAGDAREFALMGVTSERNQLILEDKIRVLSIELENTYNLLKVSERINADFKTVKKDLQNKLDNHLVQTEKWINSSKNLFKLIDSSMSVRTKVGLGFTNCVSENELGWDDSAFSIFTTTFEDVEGRPVFHRFAKTDSMKVVPLPLSRDYTSLSDHIDLDESQMSYGTKSSTFCDSKSVSNDFVSCDDIDKSSEVNTNDFASTRIESNVGRPIKEPIIVQDLPSFTCNSSDKNEHTFRTSCNKNGYFNKKAGHFRKNASSISKLCFVCGSGTHLIKDCDFYEKQMANKTVVPTGKPKVTPVPTGKPKVTLVPTSTSKPYVSTLVPTGRPNRPFPVPTDRGYSPSENPFSATEDEGIFDSGCSRSMTGNKERLDAFQAFQGGKVTFRGGEGRITRKRTIRTPTLDFENVYYVKELQQFNLFSISQICNKKNQVLFTDTECLVLFKDFKLPDDSIVVLRVPRKHNLYTINLNNLCPRVNLACLVAHASFDESMKWHRRMGHVNYKNMNRLVKGNLVRGLPPKFFKNDHTCVACCKGKQHKASYQAINVVSSIFEPLQLLHMDLFGPTSIRSIDHKYYCLVITDDYSRFCWVFFLEHKDETYPILKDFINLVENKLNKMVKATRCDNGTKFKNAHMIDLYGSKGIKREYSNPRTPQQNGVAERRNKTLIEAARTMLADSKLPTMFWTEAVRTVCYVLNRVSVTSPHTKTPYALLTGNIPSVSYFKPFGCHVTILNTSDHLGKFDGKADEGYIVGNSVRATTNSEGTQATDSDSDCDEQVTIVPSYPSHNIQGTQPKETSGDKVDDSPFQSTDEIFQKKLARLKDQEQRVTSDVESLGLGFPNNNEELHTQISAKIVPPSCLSVPPSKVPVPTGSLPVPTGSIPIPAAATKVSTDDVPVHTSSSTDSIFDDEPTPRFFYPSDLGNHDPSPGIFSSSSYDDDFGAALNNVASTVEVSPVATMRIHTIHPQSTIIRDPTSVVQTRSKEEMQHFKFQNVWVLVDLPAGKYAIGTKWILKNKRDVRGIIFRNKTRLVAQGHRQEEGIDYDEVFALVARIEAIRLFLAFTSYMGFLIYQMDVKSAFLYGRIDDEVYVTQPKGFVDPQHPKKVYKVVKSLYGLHQAQRAWTATTPYEATKPKSKNESDSPVNVHLYRSMIGSLMYLTASRPDIMFAVSACSRHQVTPTTSNLEAVKKIFRRLISWQCKKQTIVATSSTEAEYVVAANCCAQVLWIQNQLLDYGASVPSGVASVPTGSFVPTGCSLPTGFIDFPSVPTLYSDHQPAQTLNPISTSSMAALRYKDEHNKVGDLLKPNRSNDYHQIIDFLRDSHIRAPELGPPAIQATIDKTPYTITKDLVRSRLQLADDGGIADLPIAKIYSGMDNLGYVTEGKGMVSNIRNAKKFLMYPRFFQTILGEGAEVAAQAVPQPVPVSDQPTAHLSTPSKQPTSDPIASVLEHGQSSDLNTASFSRSHETDAGPFTPVDNAPMGGDFHTSPPRSSQALLQKVHSLESELKNHKKLFKDVVGKLVKKVKALEVQLKTKKRKMVVTVNVASNIPFGGTSHIPAASPSGTTAVPTSPSNVPPGTSAVPTAASTVPAGSPNVPTDVPFSAAPAGVSSKGKSPMVEEDIVVKARTFKQTKEDRLGEEAAKRLHDEEMAQMERQRAEMQRKRQQDVIDSAIMAALVKKNRQALAEQLFKERQNRPMTQAQQKAYIRQYVKTHNCAIYNIGWTMAYVKSFTDDQLKQEFEKIRKVQSNSQIQAFSRTLKRLGPVLEEPSSKRQQSIEAPIPSVPETFIKVVVNEDSDVEVWSPVVGWEVLPTPLGEINALYRIDGSTNHFTPLRQILHMVDRQDLVKLYGLVEIRSWRLYTLSNVHVLETMSGEVLSMFTDVTYPLSVKLMKRMLMHKLEIDLDVVGNDMTTSEQLIQFIKNQLAAAKASSV